MRLDNALTVLEGPIRMFGNALDRIAFVLLMVLLIGVSLMGAG